MRLPGVRSSIRGLMVSAASVALLIAAVSREDSRLPAGIITVAACLGCLTCKLAAVKLASRKAEGRPTYGWTWVRLISVAAAISVAVIGASDIAFLVIYWSYMVAVYVLAGVDHYRPWEEPGHIVMGALPGGIVALRTVSLTNRLIQIPTARPMTARSWFPEVQSSACVGNSVKAR
jgi:hypothetical protein